MLLHTDQRRNPVSAYARFEIYHWWFIARRRIVTEVVSKILPPSKEALIIDIGCGPGANLASFAASYPCIGIDTSAEAIRVAQARYPMVTFIEGNYPSNLGETTKKAKLFLLMDVLEHIEDPRPIIEDIVLAASTGAYFVVTVPADQDLWSAHDEAVGHYRRYTTQSLESLFAGLPVVPLLLSPYNSRLYLFIKIFRRLSLPLRRAFSNVKAEGTDLSIPPYPFNGILTALFSYEAIPISRALQDRTQSPYKRGVSLMYILQKTGG